MTDLGTELVGAITGVGIPMFFAVRSRRNARTRREASRFKAIENPVAADMPASMATSLVGLLQSSGAKIGADVLAKAAVAKKAPLTAHWKIRSPDPVVLAAIIVAFGLISGAFLLSGIYESHMGVKGLVLFRVNKFTGTVSLCPINSYCKEMPNEAPLPTVDASAFGPALPPSK
jgi:hypothetical protein